MKSYSFKLLAADAVVSVLLICDLVVDFSLIKSACAGLGALLLFTGTLCDHNKAVFGISAKLPYIVFVFILTKTGMWIAEEQTVSLSFLSNPSFGFAGIFAVILAAVILVVIQFMPVQYWMCKMIFDYFAVFLFFMGVSSFFEIYEFVSCFYGAICIGFFACSCFFRIMTNLRLGSDDSSYRDKSIVLAIFMCAVVFALFVLKHNCFYTASELIENIFKPLDNPALKNISFVKISAMLLLAICCFFTDYLPLAGKKLKLEPQSAEIALYSDTYVVLSVCGIYTAICEFYGRTYSYFYVCAAILLLLSFYSIRIRGTDNAVRSKMIITLIIGLALYIVPTGCAVLQSVREATCYVAVIIVLSCITVTVTVLNSGSLRLSGNVLFWTIVLFVPAICAAYVLYFKQAFSTMLMIVVLFVVFAVSIWSLGIGRERSSSRKVNMIMRFIEYVCFCVLMTLIIIL